MEWKKKVVFFFLVGLSLLCTVPYFGGVPFYNNDEATHLLNSVLIYDFLRAIPVSLDSPFSWVKLYYSHYPSIAPFVWPPFFTVAQLPAIAILGPGLVSGQLTITFFLMALLVGWYVLMRRYLSLFYSLCGVVALLFVPCIWHITHYVMLEIPALAFVPWVILLTVLHCERSTSLLLNVAVVLTTVAMLLTKQPTVIVLPIVLAIYWRKLGFLRLISPSFWFSWLIGGLVTSTYYYTSLRIQNVNASDVLIGWSLGRHLHTMGALVDSDSMGYLGLALGVIGLFGWWKLPKEKRPTFLPMMIVLNIVFFFTISITESRYLFYLVPATIFLGLCVLQRGDAGKYRRLLRVLVLSALLGQTLYTCFFIKVVRVNGMDEVAIYAKTKSETGRILYIGSYAHGFVHSMRVNDKELKTVVFRDSKILYSANWNLDRDVDVDLKNEEDFIETLERYGIDFVVVNDKSISSLIEKPVTKALNSQKMRPEEKFAITVGEQILTISTHFYKRKNKAPKNITLGLKTVNSSNLAEVSVDLETPLLP